MQRDRKSQATAKPVEELASTVLVGPMIVTDARGRPFYLSLTVLALDSHWLGDPQAEAIDEDLDNEVVRWRI